VPAPRKPVERVSPVLDEWKPTIDEWLAADREMPRKQRHTATRILERLREEHGFTGGYTIVREYVNGVALRSREMFVPLSHQPGHAQVDFGEADGYVGGKKIRYHTFCLDLPHSDAIFVKAYPAEVTEAFLDGHVAAFEFLGGVPRSILYDNTKIAVAQILGHGQRRRTRAFAELQPLLVRGQVRSPRQGQRQGQSRRVGGLQSPSLHGAADYCGRL